MNQSPYMTFAGFSQKFVDLLFALRFSNTIEQVPAHRDQYKHLITEPLMLLFHNLLPTVTAISPSIETRPSRCISTMFNDMRFSKESPIKEYMYLRFREPLHEKDVLGFYFDMGSDMYSYGIRIYKQTSAGMSLIRNDILQREKAYTRALEQVYFMGMSIMGTRFAKDHYPDISNQTAKDLLNCRNFYIGTNKSLSEIVFNPTLVQEIATAYWGLKDIYGLLKEALYQT